jgi:NADH-quinone oxidoreductase E subunit
MTSGRGPELTPETMPGISEALKAQLREIVERYPLARSAMLPCLHLVQEAQGRVTVEGVMAVAEALGVPADEVESVVTFYSMYHTEPEGRYVLKICTSISCYLRGCDALVRRFEERLGIRHGETTPDGRFTLDHIECLAACGGAPVVQVNGEFVENVTLERADELLERLTRGASIAELAARWRENGAGGFAAQAAGGLANAAGRAESDARAKGPSGRGPRDATGVPLDVAPRPTE